MLTPISELKIDELIGLQASENDDIFTLELTVTTGLEEIAALECRESLNLNPILFRGRVIVDVPFQDILKILKLRSIDNVNIIIHASSFTFTNNREECFRKLYKYADKPCWRKGLEAWAKVYDKKEILEKGFLKEKQELEDDFVPPKPALDLKLMKSASTVSANLPENVKKCISDSKILDKSETIDGNGCENLTEANGVEDKKFTKDTPETEVKDVTKEAAVEAIKVTKDVDAHEGAELTKEPSSVEELEKSSAAGPRFRVSCHRVGSKHVFGSAEAARQLGGGIHDKLSWPVDLKKYDVHVLLSIIDSFTYVAIALTSEPLFKRNLSFFGPTNLRATIAYSLVKLAKPEIADVIIDPMCGGSSIPIEGAISQPHCFNFGGDISEQAVNRSVNNTNNLIENKNIKLLTNTVRWDSMKLPLRSQIADVIVCDLPFGKRSGSRFDNRVLYYKSLLELARVTKIDTGRAVLLTHDKNSMTKGLSRVSSLWKNFSLKNINIGGLIGGVFLLKRTGILSDPNTNSSNESNPRGQKRKNSEDEEKSAKK